MTMDGKEREVFWRFVELVKLVKMVALVKLVKMVGAVQETVRKDT